MMKRLVVLFLVWSLAVPASLLAQSRDPHYDFKLGDQLPHKDYFWREFQLKAIRSTKNLTDIDSDMVIRTNPMSLKGFLTSWIQPGQMAHIIPENQHPVIVFVDAHGGTSQVVLNPGEAVVIDNRNPNAAEKDVLAVIRCGNKVIEGKITMPLPETRVVEKVVERKVEVKKIVPGPRGEKGDRGEIGFPGSQGHPGLDAKKHGHKKIWVGVFIAIGVAITAIFFPRGKKDQPTGCDDPGGNGGQL